MSPVDPGRHRQPAAPASKRGDSRSRTFDYLTKSRTRAGSLKKRAADLMQWFKFSIYFVETMLIASIRATPGCAVSHINGGIMRLQRARYAITSLHSYTNPNVAITPSVLSGIDGAPPRSVFPITSGIGTKRT